MPRLSPSSFSRASFDVQIVTSMGSIVQSLVIQLGNEKMFYMHSALVSM